MTVGGEARRAGAAVELTVQRRDADGKAGRQKGALDPAKAAAIVIDLWDRHWGKTRTARVANLVPRRIQTLEAARKLGIQVATAPSDGLGPCQHSPQRKAMPAIPAQPEPGTVPFNPPLAAWRP